MITVYTARIPEAKISKTIKVMNCQKLQECQGFSISDSIERLCGLPWSSFAKLHRERGQIRQQNNEYAQRLYRRDEKIT